MTKATPVVYLLQGEDEFAIAQFTAKLEAELGDAATGAMNTTRLDGRSYNPDELLTVAGAMPFLAARRIVILSHFLSRLSNPASHERFIVTLEKVPSTTALILIEYRWLTEERDRKRGKLHWLEKWAGQAGERVLLKSFPLAKGPALAPRIQELARAAGGQIRPDAAKLLVGLVDDDPRLAEQEIRKLLAYVNYQKPIEVDDVQALTADMSQGDIFAMVDALGARDGRKALGIMHRLLEQQDYYSIFGMVVRQFRLLLLAREVLDRGGQVGDVAQKLKIPPFIAEKMVAQARRFTRPALESIFHRLLEMDEAVKTSQISGDLALDTLVAALTNT
ncbi:MAG TPA: DNA polymerase III subunit delta [Anaerolineales bacterium]